MNISSSNPGWKMVKFEDIAQNIAVRIDPAEADTDIYVGLEHLDPDSIHLRQWGHPSDVIGQKLAFKKGDVIFGRRRAYQRKLAVAEFDGICSAHAMVVRAKPEAILPEFLPFFLQSDMFMDRAVEISVGSLSPTINWRTLRVQEFPLPPLKEQKRIAKILWAADEAVEKYKKSLKDMEIAFAKIIGNKLPRRNDPNAAFIHLSKICKSQPQSGIYKNEDFQGRGVKIVKMGTLFSNEVVTDEIEMDRIELDEKELEHFVLTSSDLLFGRRSIVLEGAGKCSRVGSLSETVTFESSILRVTIDKTKANPAFVYTWLNSPEGKKELRRIRRFTTVAGITGSDLKKIKIPDLSKEKQEEIVSFYFSNRKYVDVLTSHIELLEANKNALTRKLMQETINV